MTRSSREIPSNSTFDKVITKLFDERVMPITGCISGVCDHDGMTGRNKLRTGGVKTMVGDQSHHEKMISGGKRSRFWNEKRGGWRNVKDLHVIFNGPPFDTEDAHLVRFLMNAEQVTHDMTLPEKGNRWN